MVRILCWNCNGGLARKIDSALAHHPDILVIQETSEKDIAALNAPFAYWTGRKHRGLAVVVFGDHQVRLDRSFDPELPWFLPVHFDGMRLLAVWASVLTHRLRYVRLLHHALDHYADFIDSPSGVILGDFNSSTVFDLKHRGRSHTDLVERLAGSGYASLWHRQTSELHGEESRPTFYMYRRPERTWHLDYAFLGPAFLGNATLQLGTPDPWLTLSDHLPLILNLPSPLNDLTGGCGRGPSHLPPSVNEAKLSDRTGG